MTQKNLRVHYQLDLELMRHEVSNPNQTKYIFGLHHYLLTLTQTNYNKVHQ